MKVETISFKTEYAEKWGVECAILIQGIQLGLSINQNKTSHNKFGKVWMYNSVKDWHTTYPFMSESTIKRSLDKLRQLKIIEAKQLDSNPMNKTMWYTLNQSIISKLTNPLVQNDQMEDVKLNKSNSSNCTTQNSIKQTVLNNNINQTVTKGNESFSLDEAFEQCWKAYSSAASRQVGSKKDAAAKFKRLKSNEIESLRLHLPKFILNHQRAKKTEFLPNFVTYLNQRRFEDEKLPYPDKVAEFENNLNNWYKE
jgi:hypothetical protein